MKAPLCINRIIIYILSETGRCVIWHVLARIQKQEVCAGLGFQEAHVGASLRLAHELSEAWLWIWDDLGLVKAPRSSSRAKLRYGEVAELTRVYGRYNYMYIYILWFMANIMGFII